MFVALGRFDILLGPLGSRKAKRATVRRITASLHNKFAVAVAITDFEDLLQRTEISVAAVSADYAHAQSIAQSCEDHLARLPEFELLSARIRVVSDEDL